MTCNNYFPVTQTFFMFFVFGEEWERMMFHISEIGKIEVLAVLSNSVILSHS